MRRLNQILCCVIVAGLLGASFALTQTTLSTPASQATQTTPTPTTVQAQPAPAQNPYFEDSANLNKMAIELKQHVDTSTKDQLSLNVVRKADEIEKLAHSMKQRMRNERGQQ